MYVNINITFINIVVCHFQSRIKYVQKKKLKCLCLGYIKCSMKLTIQVVQIKHFKKNVFFEYFYFRNAIYHRMLYCQKEKEKFAALNFKYNQFGCLVTST